MSRVATCFIINTAVPFRRFTCLKMIINRYATTRLIVLFWTFIHSRKMHFKKWSKTLPLLKAAHEKEEENARTWFFSNKRLFRWHFIRLIFWFMILFTFMFCLHLHLKAFKSVLREVPSYTNIFDNSLLKGIAMLMKLVTKPATV